MCAHKYNLDCSFDIKYGIPNTSTLLYATSISHMFLANSPVQYVHGRSLKINFQNAAYFLRILI